MANKTRLVTYKSMFMPVSNCVKQNFYASSQFCDNTRDVAAEIKAMYFDGFQSVPDHFAYVEYYRDGNPDEDPENGETYVTIKKSIITRSARVDGFHMMDALDTHLPPGAQFAIIADWKDAVLTLLYFVIDKDE
jgi:hypothetical protein